MATFARQSAAEQILQALGALGRLAEHTEPDKRAAAALRQALAELLPSLGRSVREEDPSLPNMLSTTAPEAAEGEVRRLVTDLQRPLAPLAPLPPIPQLLRFDDRLAGMGLKGEASRTPPPPHDWVQEVLKDGDGDGTAQAPAEPLPPLGRGVQEQAPSLPGGATPPQVLFGTVVPPSAVRVEIRPILGQGNTCALYSGPLVGLTEADVISCAAKNASFWESSEARVRRIQLQPPKDEQWSFQLRLRFYNQAGEASEWFKSEQSYTFYNSSDCPVCGRPRGPDAGGPTGGATQVR